MKTVFISGITGLLGANLVHSFLDDGYKVIGLVRKLAAYKGIDHPWLTLVEGDLFSDLTGFMQNVDVVVHAAAETRQNLLKYSEYAKVNYNGTVLLFLMAVHCKVKKFIYISSANTLGYGSMDEPGTESMPARSPFDKSLYAKSKIEAERYLLQHAQQTNVIIINPTFMLGTGDSKPSSGRIVLIGLKKRLIFCPPGGKNFVHVEDVVQSVKKCISLEISGERFIVAGENLCFESFFKKLIRLNNQKTLIIKIPKSFLMILGYAGDLLRLMGIRCSLSSTNMRILCVENFYSNQKSIRELGISYRPVDSAILDAITYFNGEYQQFKR